MNAERRNRFLGERGEHQIFLLRVLYIPEVHLHRPGVLYFFLVSRAIAEPKIAPVVLGFVGEYKVEDRPHFEFHRGITV
ncbi:hypothetical protein EUGRSUZ_C02711 [Eucalyptus grandis]|uniref:Uncharacterized protein n=2 Tax=Eucalyptus grandis TaxID=71139 RepID=A0ACC3LGS3_EUCGR|nr:hypothetical protein EUGRSUZ_C02711 [Eucalyptus grandis]